MKKATKSNEFLFEVFSLILIAVLVQGVFATLVRPRAEALRAHDLEVMKTDKNYVPKRSPYVIVKDYEQEVCIIFSLWAFSILAYKAAGVRRARALLATDLLRLPEGMKILPEDTRVGSEGEGSNSFRTSPTSTRLPASGFHTKMDFRPLPRKVKAS